MTELAEHRYFKVDGKRVRFDAPSMAADLVAALNKLDARGGWRVTEIAKQHYRNPVTIGRNNHTSIDVQCGYPNAARGHARLHVLARPKHYYDLPAMPECSFNPERPIESIARDVLRKIDAKGGDVVSAYRTRVADEEKQETESQQRIQRLERALGKTLLPNGSPTRYFEVGPLRCSCDERGNIQVLAHSYLSEDELMAVIGLFKNGASNTLDATA